MSRPMPDQELLWWPPWRPANDLAPPQRRWASWRLVCERVRCLARLVGVCVCLSVVLLSGWGAAHAAPSESSVEEWPAYGRDPSGTRCQDFGHDGQHQGHQFLSAAKVAKALYRTDVRGLPTGVGWYHLSFWSVSHQSRTGCSFQLPYMAGLGGNLVVLLPNGISAFPFADGDNYDVDPMVLAGEALRPFPCPAGSR